MALGHETNREFNREALRLLNAAISIGLSNSAIAAADTVAGLKAALVTLQASVSEPDRILLRHAQSAVQAALDTGLVADSDILSLTTAAGLRAIFTANDSLLSATDQSCFAYSPRSGSL